MLKSTDKTEQEFVKTGLTCCLAQTYYWKDGKYESVATDD
jgi:hypothetical protein